MSADDVNETVAQAADWIAAYLSEELAFPVAEIDRQATFSSLGLGSQAGATMVGRLGRRLGRNLSVAVLWGSPTVNGLARAAVTGDEDTDAPSARRPAGDGAKEPLAVVSMAVRLPGADTVSKLWRLALAGEDAIGPPSPGRYPETPVGQVPDAGYLAEPFEDFDHRFFHLTPRETAALDPVQRLFLEVCWEAIEASSLPRVSLPGSATGVYVGSIWNERGAVSRPGRHTMHTATGSSLSMVANRVSYLYDLRGPSVTLDSACSSSLVAVHMAAQALRLGEIDAAVVGGVNLLQSAATMADLTAFGGLAPDGRSKAFGAHADGFGRGEGAVALVLKRVTDAERDGDHIWCLLHGTAVNNDGHTNGLTAPSPDSQRAVIRDAHARGGTDPTLVRFVETHGTGTALGDPIEATALAAALRGARSPVRLGTLKANIGHLEGAAGVAGLVKAALVMHHGVVPPCVLSGETSPHIDFEALNLALPTAPLELSAQEPVLGGVSSFGWGGTNAHAVVGRYDRPGADSSTPARTDAVRPSHARAADPVYVFSPFGGQWPGMGRDLLRHDADFRAAVAECDRGAAPVLGLSILELIASGADLESQGVAVCQPAVYALQVGLLRSLAARGVRPAAVVGHSLGEIAGAVAADALTACEGGRVVAHYAAAQQRLVGRGGGMAVVALGTEELKPYLEERTGVVVAGIGSPHSTNLSGPVDELDALVSVLAGRNYKASRINVDLAAHSPAVDEVRDDLVELLGSVEQFPPALPMISALDGREMAAGDFDAEYFATALRQPVDFAGALAHPLTDRADTVVEINAHGILGSVIREKFGNAGVLSAYSRSGAALDDVAAACGAGVSPARESLLTLSGHTPKALAQRCREVAQWWPEGHSPAVVAPGLAGLATLAHRVSVVADDRDRAVAGLRDRAAELESAAARPAVSGGAGPRVAFVFPGQGGQWCGMGRDLYARDPVFARHLRRCDQALREACGAPVLDLLLHASDDATFTDVSTAQPLLFAVQVALARTLEHYGVAPQGVVGHSMGEAAAAHIAGALTLHDAAAVIGRRSRLMTPLTGVGAMLATELSLQEAEELCAGSPAMSVAVSNSARSTVLSGAVDDVERTARELTDRDVFNRPVRVEVASHSPQMDPILPPLIEALADIAPSTATLPVYSTVLGRVTDGSAMNADYWADNLRAPVLFAEATERLLEDGHTVLVEISPHAVLSPAVTETAADRDVLVVPALRKEQPEWPTLLAALGQLCDAGVPVDHARLNAPGRPFPLPLPYPWQRVSTPPLGGEAGAGGDPVGVRAQLPHDPALAVHAGRLDTSTWSLGDHVIDGRVVVPAAAFAAVAAQVVAPVLGAGPTAVRDLRLPAALELTGASTALQTTVRGDGPTARVEFFGEDGGNWVRVADADVAEASSDAPLLAPPEMTDGIPAEELYRRFDERGLAFGPQYRRVRTLEVGAAGARALLDWDPRRADSLLPVDPRLLDAVLQVAAAPLLAGPEALDAGQSVLTTGAGEVSLLSRPGADPRVVTHLVPGRSSDTFLADADVLSGGRVALRVRGVEIRRVPVSAAARPESAGAVGLWEELTLLPRDERGDRMVTVVSGVVGEIAGVASAQVDPAEPFRSIGLNSIMGLELRSRLERLLGTALSSTVVWNYPTVDALAAELADRLEPGGPPQESVTTPPGPVPGPRGHMEETSAEPASDADGELAALQRELAEVEAMMGEL